LPTQDVFTTVPMTIVELRMVSDELTIFKEVPSARPLGSLVVKVMSWSTTALKSTPADGQPFCQFVQTSQSQAPPEQEDWRVFGEAAANARTNSRFIIEQLE